MLLIVSLYQRAHKAKPLLSSFSTLLVAVRGKRLARSVIKKGFIDLVDKKDYDERDVARLIDYLFQESNNPRP